jgi:predicted helicase
MTIQEYLQRVDTRFKAGISTEHSYRGDLQNLLETLIPGALITNEPTRIKCGAPDFIITRKSIPVGYIEAKDLGTDLSARSYKEQFDRYKASLPNLILTNYLDFELYRNGEPVSKITVGTIDGARVVPNDSQYEVYTSLIKDFASWVGQTITSSRKLAEMMASKARLLAKIIDNALISDEQNAANSSLKEQLGAFKNILIHDINDKEFADIYAQTIAYGMFAARLHDSSLQDFTRFEAANLIPKTNPFLRKLFQYIAGYDLDERIAWVVDALADIFRATDVAALLKSFGSATQQNDPIIHFYETFLAEYDPALRKARGVWYTPEPVVDFIVRAVDDILKTDFKLKSGLADNSRTKIKVQTVTKKTPDSRSKITTTLIDQEVHKVQILDPACGTGTFLADIIKHIHRRFKGQQGIWSSYVENDLIPRLNGFELLMASYAMAHLKLDLLLSETGFTPMNDQRFKVFLTNSLEEYHPDTGTLFASWLSDEANHANRIKRDIPVMVVIGNPPYSVSSSNKGEWIQNLIQDYKDGLNERKINLDDDYIKFLRFAEHFIEKNGQGVVAMITNNSFIDGITHRQMRKHLMSTFHKIHILDLHGSSKKQEKTPDGGKDENVFDIMQGVSISLLIKRGEPHNECTVLHTDFWGLRQNKYDQLHASSISTLPWKELRPEEPFYFFKPFDLSQEDEYSQGFRIDELFRHNNTGIQTKRDDLVYKFTSEEMGQVMDDMLTTDSEAIRSKYKLPKDGRDWTVSWAIEDLRRNQPILTPVHYHPFDSRFTLYTGRTKGFMAYPRHL